MVSDIPMVPHGIKTEKSDREVTKRFSKIHLEIGIESMTDIGQKGEKIKHFQY